MNSAVNLPEINDLHDYFVFIGRFQPWHLAHQAVALEALKRGKKLIIVLGSRDRAKTIENPWSAEERREIIIASLKEAVPDRNDDVYFTSVPDRLYNNTMWYNSINTAVKQVIATTGGNDDSKVCMIGHYKDKGSFWLDKFRQWSLLNVSGHEGYNSTDIRAAYFEPVIDVDYISSKVSKSVYNHLLHARHNNTDWYDLLSGELQFVRRYKEPYAKLPYGVKHVTADAVVFCAGHVLMIRRRSFPGKGLWALPGGHIEMDEDVNEYAAIRELMEETKLRVTLPVLEGSLKGEKVFGHPRRSLIGRVITHSYFFELSPNPAGGFHYVKGADDADKARWVPINEVTEQDTFDDHYQVIQYWLGRSTKK